MKIQKPSKGQINQFIYNKCCRKKIEIYVLACILVLVLWFNFFFLGKERDGFVLWRFQDHGFNLKKVIISTDKLHWE